MPRKSTDLEPPAKKRRHRLSLAERKKIIKKSAAGSSIGRIAQDLNISPEAVSQVLKTAGGLIRPENEDESQSLKKRGDLSVVEKAVFRWYEQQCSLGESISTQKFRNKAIEFYHKINHDELFKASSSWVDGFKTRNEIHNLNIDSSDMDKTARDALKKIERMITKENIDPEDIYNVDEVLLSWRTLPHNNLQQSKPATECDRVSIITCCNASGTDKIPLVIVGREQLELEEDIDYHYVSQPEGLVDEDIFANWFLHIFLKKVKRLHSEEKRKCYLVLDNAPPHFASVLDENKEFCEIRQLGVEVNPLVQPVNEVINKLKIEYRTKLINKFKMRSKMSVDLFSEKWKLPDACKLLSASWDMIDSHQIEDAWANALSCKGVKNNMKIPATFIVKARKLPGLSWLGVSKIRDWFAQDQGHPWKILSDDEIVEKAKLVGADEPRKNNEQENKKKRKRSSSELENNNNSSCSTAAESVVIKEEVLELIDEPDLITESEERRNLDWTDDIPSTSDALQALVTLEKWILSKTDGDQRHFYLLDQLRDIVEKDSSESASKED